MTLRSATFVSANGYTTRGGASIVLESGAYRLDLHSDFATSQSGALEVRICRGTSCNTDDINLGEIKAFSGSQSYRLNGGAPGFRYAVIWCRAVNLPFGFGELR